MCVRVPRVLGPATPIPQCPGVVPDSTIRFTTQVLLPPVSGKKGKKKLAKEQVALSATPDCSVRVACDPTATDDEALDPQRILAATFCSGGELMVREGLFERFPCEQVFGMHNWPALDAGTVGVRGGALMGSEDNFVITIKGYPRTLDGSIG